MRVSNQNKNESAYNQLIEFANKEKKKNKNKKEEEDEVTLQNGMNEDS